MSAYSESCPLPVRARDLGGSYRAAYPETGDVTGPVPVLSLWGIKAKENDDELISPRPGHEKSGLVERWQNRRSQAAELISVKLQKFIGGCGGAICMPPNIANCCLTKCEASFLMSKSAEKPFFIYQSEHCALFRDSQLAITGFK